MTSLQLFSEIYHECLLSNFRQIMTHMLYIMLRYVFHLSDKVRSDTLHVWSSYTLPEPETVLGLLDNSSSTSHLHLTILPPSYSYFNLYNIEVFRDNDSELVFDQNISLARDETDIFLWNLTAGTLYNFSVTTRTIWEESDIFSTEFVTCRSIIFCY